jgi:Secretion system C-terminal sorting domain
MKRSLLSKFLKGAALVGITILSANSTNAQTTYVTVGNLATPAPPTPPTWIAYASWFENNGNFENNQPLTYVTGSQWAPADVKSVLDATANTIALYPNYTQYNAADPYWSDGAGNGNKIFEGNTFVERTDLAGQQLVFSGKTLSTTLSADFKDTAFIKVLDPNNNYVTELYLTEALVENENFTISTGGFVIQPGRLVQYGFTVLGKNANPTQLDANGFTVVTADEPEVSEGTVVTLDATNYGALLGYATWFQPDGTWINGGSYGVPDLKTTKNDAENQLILQPNFLAYGAGPEWQNGPIGSRIFEANTYILNDALLGEVVTFKGHTLTNTLADGYTATAFVKVLNFDYTTILDQEAVELETDQDWELTLDTSSVTGGVHVQYGFIVKGLNANPNQEDLLGSAVVGLPTAGVADFTKNAVIMYPNPASTVLNFASEDTIEAIQIFNVMGQKVISVNNATTVDVSGLTNGVYIVNTTVNGKQSATRFIKQ